MVCQVIDLNFVSTRDLALSKIMKLEGYLLRFPILLLIDSEASHNFVNKELVTSLGLPITKTREFGVSLGNGSKCLSQGRCTGLSIIIGNKG